jgi:hypothetical protein
VILVLPIFIHIAFLQFFVGLVILLLGDDKIIGNVILVLVGIATFLYIATTLLPTVYPYCPFQTPISRMIRYFIPFRRNTSTSPSNKAEALAWLLQNSANEEVVKVSVQALAGLPATVEVERSLRERKVVDILTDETLKSLGLRRQSPSKESSEYLKACLYAIIRLLQTRPPSADFIFSPLKSLHDLGRYPLRWNELGRGVCEVAVCVAVRLQLLHHVVTGQESVFSIDLPVLQRACPQKDLKKMLTEAVLLHQPSSVKLLRNLQDERPETRAGAWAELKMATNSGTLTTAARI